MKYIYIILLVILLVFCLTKNYNKEKFMNIIYQTKWNSRLITINSLTINNLSNDESIYEGLPVVINFNGIIELFKAPIFNDYNLVSVNNKYIFDKNAMSWNLETPGTKNGINYPTSNTWCNANPTCKGFAIFPQGSSPCDCNTNTNNSETKLYDTVDLINTGSCRNTTGPITCIDPTTIVYNNGTPNKSGSFGGMSKSRCSSWKAQKGGWTYDTSGCTNIVGTPKQGGGNLQTLLYTKKYYDKPCSVNSDCSSQGLNPSSPIGTSNLGNYYCPSSNSWCRVKCNSNKDCKKAGLSPIITTDCFSQVDKYCQGLSIWDTYNISWGKTSLGRKLPGLASQGQSTPQWRCYKPSALTADTMNYNNTSPDYATTPELEGIWQNCLKANEIGKWKCPSSNSYCQVKCNTTSDCVNAGLMNHSCPSHSGDGGYCQPTNSNSSQVEKVPTISSPYIQTYPNKIVQIYIGIKNMKMVSVYNGTTYNNASIPGGTSISTNLSFNLPYTPGVYPILMGIEFSNTSTISYDKLNDTMVLGYITIKNRYKWLPRPWGLCNLNCSGGIKTRYIDCLDIPSNTITESKNCIASRKPTYYQFCNYTKCVLKPNIYNRTVNIALSLQPDNKYYDSIEYKNQLFGFRFNNQKFNDKYKNYLLYTAKNTEKLLTDWDLLDAGTSSLENGMEKAYIYHHKYRIYLNYNNNILYCSNECTKNSLWEIISPNNSNYFTIKHIESGLYLSSTRPNLGLPTYVRLNNAPATYNYGIVSCKDEAQLWLILPKKAIFYNNNVKFLDASTKCELQNMKLCSKPEMDIYSQMGTNSNNCLWSNTPWVINDAKFYAGYPKNNKLVNCDTNTSQAQIMCCPRDTILGLTSYSYLGKYKCLTPCVKWRQTANCNSVGLPELNGDKDCNTTISSLWSGYCECQPNIKAMEKNCSSGGGKTCMEACSKCQDNTITISYINKMNVLLNGDGNTKNVKANINSDGYININGVIGELTAIQPIWSINKIEPNQIFLKLSNGVWWLKTSTS